VGSFSYTLHSFDEGPFKSLFNVIPTTNGWEPGRPFEKHVLITDALTMPPSTKPPPNCLPPAPIPGLTLRFQMPGFQSLATSAGSSAGEEGVEANKKKKHSKKDKKHKKSKKH